MLNFKPVRRQGDGLGDAASQASAKSYDPHEDRTRQEDGPGTDINRIVKMFSPRGEQILPEASATDYTLDLQTALGAVRAARGAHATLPDDLRAKYPTWQTLLEAMENGTYETPQQERARQEAADAAEMAADEERIKAYLEKTKRNEYPTPAPKPTPEV